MRQIKLKKENVEAKTQRVYIQESLVVLLPFHSAF